MSINPVKSALKKIVSKNYHVAKAYYHYRLHQEVLQAKEPPLVIYQMGKVGSSTVRRSLEAVKLDMPIYHTHFLTENLLNLYEKKRRILFGTERESELKRIWLNQYLKKQILKRTGGRKWRIISLVREPIARNISGFFETLEFKKLNTEDKYEIIADIKSTYKFKITLDIENIDLLIKLFLEKYDHDTPLLFCDRELKGVLGIDVFATKFPKTKGYKIYHGDQADLLLIKLENLTECAQGAFKEFLAIDEFTLIIANIGNEKIYAPIYKKLRNSIVLPESYLNEMYTSKYSKHFYLNAEIDGFRTKWRQ
jgi:hypothetical protein